MAAAASEDRTEPADCTTAEGVYKGSAVDCVHRGLAAGIDLADGHTGIGRHRMATGRDFGDAFPSCVGLVKMGASAAAAYSCCYTKSMMSVKTSCS